MRGILQGQQGFVRYSLSTILEIFAKVGAGVLLVYEGFGP